MDQLFHDFIGKDLVGFLIGVGIEFVERIVIPGCVEKSNAGINEK